jgi:DNA-binding NarL/FixJ family response regulator
VPVTDDLPERLSRFPAYRHRLAAAGSVADLLAEAAQITTEELGFERAVVLSVDPGRLTAQGSAALSNPASDRLRRQMLSAPIPLRADSLEAALIRRGDPTRPSTAASQLAAALDLHEYVLAPVTPERRTLAILVADRATEPVSALERSLVTLLADILAAVLERTVSRARQNQLGAEFQHLTTSALALMHEVMESPTSLPVGDSQFPAFPLTEPLSTAPAGGRRIAEVLSAGEVQVAALLVKGRSNREIADEVFLSPETVKATVARILRKLGASNRVEAAAILLGMSE